MEQHLNSPVLTPTRSVALVEMLRDFLALKTLLALSGEVLGEGRLVQTSLSSSSVTSLVQARDVVDKIRQGAIILALLSASHSWKLVRGRSGASISPLSSTVPPAKAVV
jgi:hypothetical protein